MVIRIEQGKGHKDRYVMLVAASARTEGVVMPLA
jgi:hypothetical protein